MSEEKKQLEPEKPWIEKHRVSDIEQIVGQEDLLSMIDQFISAKQTIPHFLFHGPPGTGKTTGAIAVCVRLHGQQFRQTGKVLQLNASDERGLEVIRTRVKDFVKNKGVSVSLIPSVCPYKIVILDECDSMIKSSQNALRCVIEKYSEYTRWILIANELGSIIDALKSRCHPCRFQPLPASVIGTHLNRIAEKEGIRLHEKASEALGELAKGDMRKGISHLQTIASSRSTEKDVITLEQVQNINPVPTAKDMQTLLEACQEKSVLDGIRYLRQWLQDKRFTLNQVLSAMHDYLLALPRSKCADLSRRSFFVALADIEYQLVKGGSEELQLSAFVSIFSTNRASQSVSK